jgi:hypothetical protein
MTTNIRNVDASTTAGAMPKMNLSAFSVVMSSFWSHLPTSAKLQGAERAGLHRAEAALHEGHELEEVQVDHATGQEQQCHQAQQDPEDGLLPVREFEPEDERLGHRSMSPRMK